MPFTAPDPFFTDAFGDIRDGLHDKMRADRDVPSIAVSEMSTCRCFGRTAGMKLPPVRLREHQPDARARAGVPTPRGHAATLARAF